MFDDGWGAANRKLIDGFLAASEAATRLLATSPAEWARIRGLMDASDNTLFEALQRRFIAGIDHAKGAMLEAQAAQIQAILAGAGLAAGAKIPPGVFWHAADGR